MADGRQSAGFWDELRKVDDNRTIRAAVTHATWNKPENVQQATTPRSHPLPTAHCPLLTAHYTVSGTGAGSGMISSISPSGRTGGV